MNFLNNLAPHAHWFLRIALASVFLYHGLGKFGNLSGMAEQMQMPVFLVALLGAAESLGGIFILAGGVSKEWMTRVAGLIFAVVMVGAILIVHLPHGWNSIGNLGMEFQFTLLMIALFFLVRGNSVGGGTTRQEPVQTQAEAGL
ncbi:DoxX family protein [Rhodocaloribacter litoris]|uniref:DoxX family protein n=1 Tax=Rhodocaloribacter litoris TaxID=2558931 RepID=UPI001420AA41|nr:DoxX family protein [Rhodocaloribacter litoris]QXD13836.1 DoxX family protein [Rhodocaloribacter litoris]